MEVPICLGNGSNLALVIQNLPDGTRPNLAHMSNDGFTRVLGEKPTGRKPPVLGHLADDQDGYQVSDWHH